jgi:hypothetical protein
LQALNGNLFVCLIICATGDNMKVHTQVSPLIEGKANGKTTGVHESAPAPANLVGMSIEFPNKNIETGVVSVGSFAGAGSTFRGLVQVRKYLHLRAKKYMSINMCLNKMKHNFFFFLIRQLLVCIMNHRMMNDFPKFCEQELVDAVNLRPCRAVFAAMLFYY